MISFSDRFAMDRYQVYRNEIGGDIDNCSWFLNRADSNKHVQQSQNVTKVCILDELKCQVLCLKN